MVKMKSGFSFRTIERELIMEGTNKYGIKYRLVREPKNPFTNREVYTIYQLCKKERVWDLKISDVLAQKEFTGLEPMLRIFNNLIGEGKSEGSR
jgi:hypothetical protein